AGRRLQRRRRPRDGEALAQLFLRPDDGAAAHESVLSPAPGNPGALLTMGLYPSIEVSATGLSAQRLAMDVIANNIANVNTTRTAEGGPFKRQLVVFQQKNDPTSTAASTTGDPTDPATSQ